VFLRVVQNFFLIFSRGVVPPIRIHVIHAAMMRMIEDAITSLCMHWRVTPSRARVTICDDDAQRTFACRTRAAVAHRRRFPDRAA
jgi:hypothetical protein